MIGKKANTHEGQVFRVQPAFSIRPAATGDIPDILRFVHALLRELGPEADEAEDATTLPDVPLTLIAESAGEAVGVVTLAESRAIFAGGAIGIINELYVVPAWRSRGVGAALLDAVAHVGRARGWKRIEVTAPEEATDAVLAFYDRAGFGFAGPKLKRRL